MMNKALSYNFKLNDLNKYSKNMRVKDLEWKFGTTTVLGSSNELFEKEEEPQKKIRFVKNSLFYTLYK